MARLTNASGKVLRNCQITTEADCECNFCETQRELRQRVANLEYVISQLVDEYAGRTKPAGAQDSQRTAADR